MPKKGKASPLAHKLKMMRINQGLTQAELAEKAEVSRLSIVHLEGDSTSGRDVLPKILQVLENYDPDLEEQ